MNVFYVGFVWDDNFFLLQGIRGLKHFTLFGGKGVYYRPLVGLSLGIDHFLWGWRPWGYHLTNLLFHLLNVVLVFWVVSLLLDGDESRDRIASVAALLFGLYPLSTESVCWISGRTDLMAFTFFMLGVAFHLLYRREGGVWLLAMASFAFLCSLFSKEVGLAFLVLLPLLDLVVLRERNFKKKGMFLGYLAYGAVALLYLFLRKASFHPIAERLLAGVSFKVTQGGKARVFLDTFSALGFYVRRALWPFTPNLFIGAVPGGYALNILISVFFLLSLIFSFVYYLVKRKGRFVVLALFWFLVGLIPVAPLAATGVAKTPVADRYLYVSVFPLVFLVSLTLWEVARKREGSWGVVLALCLSLPLWVVTFHRTVVWTDNQALWAKTVAQSPRFGTPRVQYGLALMRKGRVEKALEQFRMVLGSSIEASPETRAHAADDIGLILMNQGRLEESISYFERALKLAPWDVVAYHDLGIVYLKLARREGKTGYLEKAREYLEKAISVNSTIVDSHYYLGVVYAHLGDTKGALREFKKVVEMDPRHPAARAARAWIERLSSGGLGAH